MNLSNRLRHANEKLKINNNKVVFVYSAPKVGSTSIVSSLRIFGIDKFDIIHIHDETMLKVLSGIDDVSINDIISYNASIGKEVYVLNIYRSPIERKISAFFEKIGSYHFNNRDEIVNNYNIEKVIKRFNNIFPHIAQGDHFIDKYGIEIPGEFDYVNKSLLVTKNNVKYITLRLKDSDFWGNILTNIFGVTIRIKRDYESNNKPIKDLYKLFKRVYRIPRNLLEEQMNDKYLKYYYSSSERNEYYNQWLNKSGSDFVSYTSEEYKLYEEITIENSHIDYVQLDHYFDEGCICKACSIKRNETAIKLLKGVEVTDRIIHNEAKNELLKKREYKINKLNEIIRKMPAKRKTAGKDFNNDMNNILKNYSPTY